MRSVKFRCKKCERTLEIRRVDRGFDDLYKSEVTNCPCCESEIEDEWYLEDK